MLAVGLIPMEYIKKKKKAFTKCIKSKTRPIICSKSPVPVGGADEPRPPEELQRSKVQYEMVIMSFIDLNSMLLLYIYWYKTVFVCLVCSFLFIRIQQQETSWSSGDTQTHAVPPTGRWTQDQPIARIQWSPIYCTLGERNTGAGTVNEANKNDLNFSCCFLIICCDFKTSSFYISWSSPFYIPDITLLCRVTVPSETKIAQFTSLKSAWKESMLVFSSFCN